MRTFFNIFFILITLLISCGTSKPIVGFSKETVKDIAGDCSRKGVGNYAFINSSEAKIEVTIWDNPNRMGTKDYPQGISINIGNSQTLYDLKPGVYVFVIRKLIPGQPEESGQFKVEICKEKTYNYR